MIFIMTFSALIFAAQNAALLLQKSRAFPEGLIAKRKKISMLTISTIKENCFASSYSKGRELFLEKKYKDVEISGGQDEDGEPFQMIQGQVKGHSSHWYTTEVYMDEDDDIKDYYCTCPAYAAYYGMCKHCVALALEYRDMERENKGSVYPVNSWEKDTSAVLNTLMDRFSHQERAIFLISIMSRSALSRSFRGLTAAPCLWSLRSAIKRCMWSKISPLFYMPWTQCLISPTEKI